MLWSSERHFCCFIIVYTCTTFFELHWFYLPVLSYCSAYIPRTHFNTSALLCMVPFSFFVFEFIAIKTCTGVTSVDVQLCIAGSSTIGGIHLTSLARGLRVVRAAAISLVVDEFGAQAAWVHSEFRCALPHFAGLLWSYGSTGVCVRAECA